MNKLLLTLLSLLPFSAFAQSDDLGLDFSASAEKKLCKNVDFTLEGNLRTQDNTSAIERVAIGGAFDFKVVNTKKLDLKLTAGWEHIWQHRLCEVEDKYKSDGVSIKGRNITDSYLQPRHRTTAGVAASYSPNKRWTFSLKESVQYNHYNAIDSIGVTKERYQMDGNGNQIVVSERDFKQKISRDRFVLRSKATVKYDIRRSHFAPFASFDYGLGLNYSTFKRKYIIGTDYKISKTNKLSVSYRFQSENDDDEPNGHIIGISYNIKL